jgi:hypothetical protein
MNLMRANLYSTTVGILLAASMMSIKADFVPVTPNGSGGYDVNLYETVDGTPTGKPSEEGPLISMPVFLDPGYLVLLSSGDPNNPADYLNRMNWSDVVQFTYTDVQLFSAWSNGISPYFPDVGTVTNAHHLFMLETGFPTLYQASVRETPTSPLHYYNYYIWSEDFPPVVVPEPSQIASGAVVLVGAAGYALRHWRRRRQPQP